MESLFPYRAMTNQGGLKQLVNEFLTQYNDLSGHNRNNPSKSL
jgi:hypothetical protein